MAGIVKERVLTICDANLRPDARDAKTRIRGYTSVLKTLEAEYPIEDPILLLWRVWDEKRETALAYDPIHKGPPTSVQARSYQSMAKRFHPSVRGTLVNERDVLLHKIHDEGRPLTREDITEARTRINYAVRSREKNT